MEQGSPAPDVFVKTSPKTGCPTSKWDWGKIYTKGEIYIFNWLLENLQHLTYI